MKKFRLKKYIVLPAILFLYLVGMALYFHETLTVYHDYLRYFGTIAAELAILILLFFFLKRRDKLRQERENDITESKRDNN